MNGPSGDPPTRPPEDAVSVAVQRLDTMANRLRAARLAGNLRDIADAVDHVLRLWENVYREGKAAAALLPPAETDHGLGELRWLKMFIREDLAALQVLLRPDRAREA